MGICCHTQVVALTVLLFCSGIAWAAPSKNTTSITRASAEIQVDGRLDDPAWKSAVWFNDFIQNSPVFGANPSMKTSFASLYDSEKIYFAVRCDVTDPGSLLTRLTRRDRSGDFDNVAITLSPRGDNRTGYTFNVNPDGVQRDLVWTTDTTFDANWDAVWQAETRIEEDHWSLEIAIPLDQIRFPAGRKSWGLQVTRWISTIQEESSFSPISPESSSHISQTGTLKNTENISPRLPILIKPEAFASHLSSSKGFDGRPEDGFDWGMGGYAKVGIAPDWTLDLAVNPDFGEVEVDQAVLNLSTIETQFAEKRPFFLESVGLFKTPIQLFYSRRLGAGPPDLDLEENEEIERGPKTTQILTAAKLTGRTANGISVGVIEALMMPTIFEIRNTDTGETRTQESTPWTNAGVLRMVGELDQGSNFGVMGTALNPSDGHRGSYTGGVDWNIYTNDKEYALKGQVAGSYRLDEITGKEAERGSALITTLYKQGGEHIRGHIDYQLRSKDFDTNDVGYLGRADLHHICSHLQYREMEKKGPFLNLYTGVFVSTDWNTDGVNLTKWGDTYFYTKWANSWWTDVGLFGSLAHFDDREMGEDGPALNRPSTGGGWFEISTPERKPLGARLRLDAGSEAHGYNWKVKPTFLVRFGRLELELAAGYGYTEGRMGFVDLLNEDQPNEEYVIGKRDVNELDFSLKGTFVIVRNLTFQFYNQLLLAQADYYDFQSLSFDRSTAQTDYTADNPDFATSDFRTQLLIMWEYLPGSNLYLVYTRFGQGSVDTRDRSFGRSRETIDNEHEQLFMLKLSHRFG